MARHLILSINMLNMDKANFKTCERNDRIVN